MKVRGKYGENMFVVLLGYADLNYSAGNGGISKLVEAVYELLKLTSYSDDDF